MIKESTTQCFHCGEPCLNELIEFEDHAFCCNGCKTVYEILSSNDLCNYYDIENTPGISPDSQSLEKLAYLDNPEIIDQIVDFQDENICKVSFYIPQIHCSSCLWLLENLYKLNENIIDSRVNFVKKETSITFKREKFSIRQLVELLSRLGYEPRITLDQTEKKRRKVSRKLIYQVGLAGFAFGNIMLMSLPEYFGLDYESSQAFRQWFGWLNLALATPVTLYSGQDYFRSSLISLRNKRLNIDVPISLGIIVLYVQSSYEILTQSGPGYFDSLCGLLFFLLLGKIFQEKTYHQLSFERDYKSYFPISVSRINHSNQEESIPIKAIKKGDRLLIRNGELIPVDAVLISDKAKIDNSFATGESDLIEKQSGDKIYAGGRHEGEAIIIEAIKELQQSKLTRLWNNYQHERQQSGSFSNLTDQISQWFTPIILSIAIFAGLFHYFQSGLSVSISIVSAVLIVACPCALALAAPFAFGHASRFLGQHAFYLRDSLVIEDLAKIQHIVFDKTGTLTFSRKGHINYTGKKLTDGQQHIFRSIFNQSNHPLSKLILQRFTFEKEIKLESFEEIKGRGMEATYRGNNFQVGSAEWLAPQLLEDTSTKVVLCINQVLIGYFTINNVYRTGLESLIQKLNKQFQLSVISGDSTGQQEHLQKLFETNSNLHFNQSPEDKLHYIRQLQNNHEKVMMVGDGLNDAGALKQSDVGLVIAEDTNAFSPACDVILNASQFGKLKQFIDFAGSAKTIVIVSFIISFLYNLIGLSFAVRGLLSPVFAAILMPLSSITVVAFVSLAVFIQSKKL